MRIIASFYKHEQVMFVSHLDMQRLFQRAFRRADLPLAYSNGFNPHPLLSFATALSVGYTSDCEYFDVMLSEYVSPAEFKRRVNAVLPQGVHIVDAVDAGEFKASLTPLMRSAEYDIELEFAESVPREAFYVAVDEILNGGEIIVSKKTKGGIKDVDIRRQDRKAPFARQTDGGGRTFPRTFARCILQKTRHKRKFKRQPPKH